MNQSEVTELRKRFSKSNCSFTKLCGCYVDSEKRQLVNINENFLNLDEDEFHKYLDIAKKTLSGPVGDHLLNLEFPMEEEQPGGRQHFLMELKESALKDEDLLERFYELIIHTYEYPGNYLILLFHDAYDVMKRTSDRMQLDESEEVFTYLLCAVCPVQLSKPGLGYREKEHRIGSRIQDWVVGAPDSGFLFPAFNDRSTDIHSLLFYTKDTKNPHTELMESALACAAKDTATIKRRNFESILEQSIGNDSIENEMLMIDIQQNLNDMLTEQVELFEKKQEDYVLDSEQLDILIQDSNVPEESAEKLKTNFEHTFVDEPPVAAHLLDARTLKSNAQKKEKIELVKEVAALNKQLNEAQAEDAQLVSAVKTKHLHLKVAKERVSQLKSAEIDGQSCLIVPLEDGEEIVL